MKASVFAIRNKPCGSIFSIDGIVGVTVDKCSVISLAGERSKIGGIGKCTVYDAKVLYSSAFDNAKQPGLTAGTESALGHNIADLMVLSVVNTGKWSSLAADGHPSFRS